MNKIIGLAVLLFCLSGCVRDNVDYRVVTDRTIDSHIKNLRRKLESLDAEQSFIRAVYGVGYRWKADACRIV